MKKRSRIIVTLVTAALTFGGLMAAIGPKKCHHFQERCEHHSCHHDGRTSENKPQ